MENREIARLKKRYQALAKKIAAAGPILQGSISERVIKGKGGKKQKEGETYGPYYQWTFKEDGKTRTVNLSKQQAKVYQKAIDENKKIARVLGEMRELSKKILEAQTKGVKRRKPAK